MTGVQTCALPILLELQAIGCHNVNLVTPEHVVPQILEALPTAVEHGLRLPIVYNTSAYDSLDSLRLLDGVVDVYMPDFKLWTRGAARRYLKRADYPDVAREAIREMHRQVGDLVAARGGVHHAGAPDQDRLQRSAPPLAASTRSGFPPASRYSTAIRTATPFVTWLMSPTPGRAGS